MAVIETKFAIGDVVYLATCNQSKKSMPCPDCLGSHKWKAVTPAGAEHEFSCPRCAASYQSNRDLSLDYVEFTPSFQRLTIGSIRHDTSEQSGGRKTSYMAHETGIGSGSIYYEDSLFSTEEGALAAAKIDCQVRNSETEWVVKLYDKTLSLSDYQFKDAQIEIAERKASEIGYAFRYFKEDLAECLDMDDLKALLARSEPA